MSASMAWENPAPAEPVGPSSALRHGQAAPEGALIRQKMFLLESYLKTKAAVRTEAGDDATAKSLMQDARRLLHEATDAIASHRIANAGQLIDLAIRRITVATARITRKKPSMGREQAIARYEKYRASIANLLEHLNALVKPIKAKAEVDGARQNVENAYVYAENLVQSGRYHDANGVMAGAYREVAQAIVKRTKGHVVVSSLEFASPREEYDYERRRNETYYILVRIMLDEKKTFLRSLQHRADEKIAESRELVTEAKKHAATEAFAKAIGVMEQSTDRLIWVLQAGGIPVAN